jgi:hypothetical protein
MASEWGKGENGEDGSERFRWQTMKTMEMVNDDENGEW